MICLNCKTTIAPSKFITVFVGLLETHVVYSTTKYGSQLKLLKLLLVDRSSS